jgi:hypothetical protein
VRSLEEALANVKALQTLLPMCAYCKSIRSDQNYWRKWRHTSGTGVSFSQLLANLLRALRETSSSIDDVTEAQRAEGGR